MRTAGAVSVLTTTALSGSPFGAGAITVDPGGTLRLPAINSAYTGAYSTGSGITLLSDAAGLAAIGVAYNGALPSFTLSSSSSGPFAGVLALDTGGLYIPTTPLNLNSIGGSGTFFLGSTTGAYYAGTLAPGANNTYRLGGGTGGLSLGATLTSIGTGNSLSSNGIAENVLTGSASVQIGALSGAYQSTSVEMVNGNGTVTLWTANNSFSGTVSVNLGSALQIVQNFALGTNTGSLANAALQINGGSLNTSSGNVYLPATTNVTLLGDFLSTSSSDLVIAGNVAMSPNAAVGATRTFNLNINSGTTGEVAINGVLSGAAGSDLIKSGSQVLVLNGANTYQGTTTITAGTISVGTNVAPNVAGALGISDTPIILGGGTLQLAGEITISRDINTTAASTIIGIANATQIISGAIIDTNNLTIGQFGGVNGSNTLFTFAGGQLDLQGAISGVGNVTIGADVSGPSNTGTVRLSSNSNGYSLNTFTGGVTLGAARLVIAASAALWARGRSPSARARTALAATPS